MAQGQKQKNAHFIDHAFEINDITHAYSWDKSDFEFFKKKYALIRDFDKRRDIASKRKLVADLETKLARVRNDQTAVDESANNCIIEPLNIVEKVDRVVNAGRTRAAELITGESGYRFDYAAIGISKLPVFDSDDRLGQEVNRINIRDSGYASAAGAVIKHSGMWTPGLQSVTVWEFAPVDLPFYDIMQMIWARVLFPENNPLTHLQNEDFFTITHSAYTSSTV